MDDTRVCPICNQKLRSYAESYNLYFKRLCDGVNHFFQILVEVESSRVDYLKISLTPDYSVFLTIDYRNKNCLVSCLKNGKSERDIEIPRIIEPDFPDLVKLKEKIGLYVVFS